MIKRGGACLLENGQSFSSIRNENKTARIRAKP